MPIVEDELWKHPGNPGMIVVTASASITADGRLVMRDRAGLEASQRIPEIEYQCAQQILANHVDGVYGFLPVRPFRPQQKIIGFGLFQVRRQWDAVIEPGLVEHSMGCLRQYLQSYPDLKIRMNYPETGESDPTWPEIAPLLTPLPLSVTLCHNGEVAPRVRLGPSGAKELYLLVERLVLEGRTQMAVEYLLENGYDDQTAQDQVAAVQRDLRARAMQEAQRLPHRGNQLPLWVEKKETKRPRKTRRRNRNIPYITGQT